MSTDESYSSLNSGSNIMINKKSLLYVQDSTSLVFGLAAGILQLESWDGFLAFLGCYTTVCLIFILWTCQLKPQKFFQSPIQDIFIESLFRELTGFVMAWTFSYALVGWDCIYGLMIRLVLRKIHEDALLWISIGLCSSLVLKGVWFLPFLPFNRMGLVSWSVLAKTNDNSKVRNICIYTFDNK